MRTRGAVTCAALLAIVVSMTATGARAAREKESGTFSSTGVDDDAAGIAKLVVRRLSDGKFEVRGKKLDPGATYDVLVDGVLVGQFTTSNSGSGRIRFRSRPRSSRDLLLGFDPRGALIVIRNSAGQDVLAVQLSGTSAVGAGEIACCIPDDSGPHCEDRTVDECAWRPSSRTSMARRA